MQTNFHQNNRTLKKILLLLILFFSFSYNRINAQSHQGVALNFGYTYINTNAGYIGGEYAYRSDPYNWKGIAIGIGAYYGSFNGNFKFIPETHLTYSNTLILGELSASPYNINPSIGINGMNIVRLKVGYSWKLGHENISMTGITFGINFLLGTKGFYDEFKLM
jgi:hypothetical protein